MKNSIEQAINLIEKKQYGYYNLVNYCPIYLFTTENIKGITNSLDVTNKNILTVSSSGDHILNMLLNGATNIESYDINYLCTDIVDAYGELNFDLIKETHGNLLDLITDVIKNLDLTDDVFDKGYSFMGKELGIYIDIAANRNAVDLSGESFYVKVDEYKFYDWLELTVYLISDKIFWSDVDDENWD